MNERFGRLIIPRPRALPSHDSPIQPDEVTLIARKSPLEDKELVKLPPKWTLLCAKCGTPFQKTGWIIGARAGIGGIPGYAWYYVKCPICSQRHWNKLVHLEIGKRLQ